MDLVINYRGDHHQVSPGIEGETSAITTQCKRRFGLIEAKTLIRFNFAKIEGNYLELIGADDKGKIGAGIDLPVRRRTGFNRGIDRHDKGKAVGQRGPIAGRIFRRGRVDDGHIHRPDQAVRCGADDLFKTNHLRLRGGLTSEGYLDSPAGEKAGAVNSHLGSAARRPLIRNHGINRERIDIDKSAKDDIRSSSRIYHLDRGRALGNVRGNGRGHPRASVIIRHIAGRLAADV